MSSMTGAGELPTSTSGEMLQSQLLHLREELRRLALGGASSQDYEPVRTAAVGNAKLDISGSIQNSISLVQECRSIVTQLEYGLTAPAKEGTGLNASRLKHPSSASQGIAAPNRELPPLLTSGATEGRGKHGARIMPIGSALSKSTDPLKSKDKITHNVATTLLLLTDAMRTMLHVDEISVLMPAEDGSKEFHVVCCAAERERSVSKRRLSQIEASCWSTGYFISYGPDGMVDVSESAIAEACVSEELLHGSANAPAALFNKQSSISSQRNDRDAHVLCCPVRCCATDQPIGVASAIGRRRLDQAPFSVADEHHMLSCATLVAHILQHIDGPTSLMKAYTEMKERVGLSATRAHLAASPARTGASHRSEGVMPGVDTQLIARNASCGECSRVKMITEGGLVEEIHSRTPLITVFQYIMRLEESWKRSVLANSSLKAAYEERQDRCRHLLERLRLCELKCSVLESERIASIDPSEPHHELFFRRGDVYSCCKCGESTCIMQENNANTTHRPSRDELMTTSVESNTFSETC